MSVSPSHIPPAHPTIQPPHTHHRHPHHPHHGQNALGRAPAIRRMCRQSTWPSPIIERWPPFTSFPRENHIQSQTTPWSLRFGNSRMHHLHRHRQNLIACLCFMGQSPSSSGLCLRHPRPPQHRLPCRRPRWTPAVHKRRHEWPSRLSINYQPVQ